MRLLNKFIKIFVLVAAAALFLLFLVGQFAPRTYLGTTSVTLPAPASDVYAWLTDVDDIPNRRPQVIRIEYQAVNDKGLPVWHEYSGDTYSIFEVLEMEKNRRFTVRTVTSNFGLQGLWAYVLTDRDGATTVEITEESTTTSLINNVIFNLLGRKYTMKQEIKRLKSFAVDLNRQD